MNIITRKQVDGWYDTHASLFFLAHPIIELNDYMRYIEGADHNFFSMINLNIEDDYSEKVTNISYMAELETYGVKYNEVIDPEDWKDLFWFNILNMVNSTPILNQQFTTVLGVDTSQPPQATVDTQTTTTVVTVQSTHEPNVSPSQVASEYLDIKMFEFNDNFKFSNRTILAKGDKIIAIGESVYVKDKKQDKFQLSDLNLFMVLNNGDKFIEQKI